MQQILPPVIEPKRIPTTREQLITMMEKQQWAARIREMHLREFDRIAKGASTIVLVYYGEGQGFDMEEA